MEVLQPDSGQKQAGKENLKPAVKPKPKVFPKPSMPSKFASTSVSGHSTLPTSLDSPTSGFSKSPTSFATPAVYNVRSPTSASPTFSSQKRPLSPSDSTVSQTKSFARSNSVEVPSAQKINCLAGPRPYSSAAAGTTWIRRPSFRLGHAGSPQSEEAPSLGNESDGLHGSVLPMEEPAIQRATGKPHNDQPSPPSWQTKDLQSPPVAPKRTSGKEYGSSNISDRIDIKNQETVDGQEHHYAAPARSGTDVKAIHSHSLLSSAPPQCEQLPPGGPGAKQYSELSTAEGSESEKLQDIKKPPLTERKQVSFKVKPVVVGQASRRFPGTTVEEILAKIEQERVTPELEKSQKMAFSFEQPSTFSFGQRASFRMKGSAFSTKVEESGSEGDSSGQGGNQILEGLATKTKQPESSVSDLTAQQSGESVQHAQECSRKDDQLDHQLQKEIPTDTVDFGEKGQKLTTNDEMRIASPEGNRTDLAASSPELHQVERVPVSSMSEKSVPAEVHQSNILTSVCQPKPAETLLSSRDALDVSVTKDKFYTADSHGSESFKSVQASQLEEASKPTLPYCETEQQDTVSDMAPQVLDQSTTEETIKHVDRDGAPSSPSLDQTYLTANQSAPCVPSVLEEDQEQNKQLISEAEKTSTTSSSEDMLQEKETLPHESHLGRPLAHRGGSRNVASPSTCTTKQTDSFDSVDSDWMLSNSFVWSPGTEPMLSEMAQQPSTESRLDTSEVPSQDSQGPLEFWIGADKAEAKIIQSDIDITDQETQESKSCANLSSSSDISVQTPDQEILNAEQRDHKGHEKLEKRSIDGDSKDFSATAVGETRSEDHNLHQSPALLNNIEISTTNYKEVSHSPVQVIDESHLTADVLTSSLKSTTVTKHDVSTDNAGYDQTLSEVTAEVLPTEQHAVSGPESSFSSEETSQPELFTAKNNLSSFAAPTETSECQPTNDVNYKTESFGAHPTEELTSNVILDQSVSPQIFSNEEQNGIHISRSMASSEVRATKEESQGILVSNFGIVDTVSTTVPSHVLSVTQSVAEPEYKEHIVAGSSVSTARADTAHIISTVEELEKAADTSDITPDQKSDPSQAIVGILVDASNDGQVYEPEEKYKACTESMDINDSVKCTETSITHKDISSDVSQVDYPRETGGMFPSIMLLEPMRHVSQTEVETVTKQSAVNSDSTDPNHLLLQSFTKDNLTEENLSEIQTQTDAPQNESPVSFLRTDEEEKKASFTEQHLRSQDAEGDVLVRQMDGILKETTEAKDIGLTSGFINTVNAGSYTAENEALIAENTIKDSASDNQDGVFIRLDPDVDITTFQEKSLPNLLHETKMEPIVACPLSQDEVTSVSIIDEVSFCKTKEVNELESKVLINVLEPIEPVIKSPPPVEPCIMFQESPVILEQAKLSQDSLYTAEISEPPCGEKTDLGSKELDKEKFVVISEKQVQPITEEEKEVTVISAEVLVHAQESPALTTVDTASGGESPSPQEKQHDSSTESQQLKELIPVVCDNTEMNIKSEEQKMKELEEPEHTSINELQEDEVLKPEQVVPKSTVEDVDMFLEDTKETQLENKFEIMEQLSQENREEVHSESLDDMPPSVSPQNVLDGLLKQEQRSQSDHITTTKSEESTTEGSSDVRQTESLGALQEESTADVKVSPLQSESPSTATGEDSSNQSDITEGTIASCTEDKMEDVVNELQPEKSETVSSNEVVSEGQIEGEENVIQSEKGDMDVSCASADQDKMESEQEAGLPEADFSFLENVSVLNTTAHRCRADLNRKRGHRTPVTPLGKDKDKLDGDDWLFRDSTEPRPARAESEDLGEEEEEKEKEEEATDETERKKRKFKFSKSLIFPKLDSSQKGKTRARNKSEVEEKKEKEAVAASETAPFQRSKSFKLPSLTRSSKGDKEKGEKSERSSPQWLQALKLKKKSQNK
ncbi:uncharacterized protein LOC122811979 [Protopterus annectens]|uniref:uncharacterized protein LOC122811979 n=1 Tax=Protopterus annectens TaxID=7888 RepID=UPI001CFC33CC|nr:uncharacterized protein LOC122811979 [Protopterus annectens]